MSTITTLTFLNNMYTGDMQCGHSIMCEGGRDRLED